MAWVTESQVRTRAIGQDFGLGFKVGLIIRRLPQLLLSHFDIFLSHAIRDAELILGLKLLLEAAGKTVYVDWIDDPDLDRTQVTGETAEMLRTRMRQSDSLFYAYSQHSRSSRWMPWELGYFDGFNGNVAILPIVPDVGIIDFDKEEYLQIYPKVDATSVTTTPNLFINKTKRLGTGEYLDFDRWRKGSEKLRP